MKMKKIILVLAVVILLPLSAFAAKKKPQADSPDWLNAPTPDGSPTLKETSDWLANSLADYAGVDDGAISSSTSVSNVAIDNTCTFRWSESYYREKHPSYVYALPLGAVSEITALPDNGGNWFDLMIKTGDVAAIRGSGQMAIPVSSIVTIQIGRRPSPKLNAPSPETAEQMAPRIQKALQHAADLCRSTYQAPPQAKQAF
jgi:hypothetical protein